MILNEPIKNIEFVILDIETTGISAQYNKIIEIALIKVKNGKIIDQYHSLFNPERYLPFEITKLTGITESDLEEAPLFYSKIYEINNFILDTVLVAHNSNFDISFLKQEFQRAEEIFPDNPIICTLKLSRKLFPFLQSKSLSSVAKHLNVKYKKLHNAYSDASITAKVFLKCISILQNEYNINTVNELIEFQSLPISYNKNIKIKKGISKDFINLPNSPGVYIFKNEKDKTIYIGKSKSLKQRVTNHLSQNASKKSKEIIKKSSLIEFKETPTELTALLAESQLIKLYLPKYNVQLKNYSSNFFIKVRLTHPFPDISVTSKIDFDGNDYFGPYNSRETAKNLVDIIDKAFMLRECSDKVFNKKQKCYLYDIHRCTGNCMESITIETYKTELEHVYEFLSGKNQSAINRLLERMKRLSLEQKYEEAAEVRDVITAILKQLNKSSIISVPINRAKVLIEANYGGKKDYLLLINGKIYIKDFILNEKEDFDSALDDYFNNTINYENINLTDLENIKIALAWLVHNRNKVTVYYLDEYTSKNDLATKIGLSKSKINKKVNKNF